MSDTASSVADLVAAVQRDVRVEVDKLLAEGAARVAPELELLMSRPDLAAAFEAGIQVGQVAAFAALLGAIRRPDVLRLLRQAEEGR